MTVGVVVARAAVRGVKDDDRGLTACVVREIERAMERDVVTLKSDLLGVRRWGTRGDEAYDRQGPRKDARHGAIMLEIARVCIWRRTPQGVTSRVSTLGGAWELSFP